jgi:hypothetical protein
MSDNTEHQQQVLEALQAADDPQAVRDITEATGLKTAEVKEALAALRADGHAEAAKVGRSERWSATSGPAEPEPQSEEAPKGTGDQAQPDDQAGQPVEQSPVDPEIVFAATMLDQVGTDTAFTIGSFAERCGKTTTAERNRLLRALWALAEHGLVRMANPSEIEGGGWVINETGLAATVIERRIQSTDAPDEIEVRAVKRMPWANGGTKGNRSRALGVRNDTKPARKRGELREQIDAVLDSHESGATLTPREVADAVRAADAHSRDADPHAVSNYLAELTVSGRVERIDDEAGRETYRLN